MLCTWCIVSKLFDHWSGTSNTFIMIYYVIVHNTCLHWSRTNSSVLLIAMLTKTKLTVQNSCVCCSRGHQSGTADNANEEATRARLGKPVLCGFLLSGWGQDSGWGRAEMVWHQGCADHSHFRNVSKLCRCQIKTKIFFLCKQTLPDSDKDLLLLT